MPDARCTRDLVCNVHKKVRTRAYRAAEAIRHSLRNGFTAYNVISPVIGFLATVTCRSLHKLDASAEASGPHDFAVRFSAVRQRHVSVHRNPSNVRDDGQRPLCPESLAECANGRLSTNRPLLELSPYAPKVAEPVSERGTAPVSSSTRTVARASSPNRARKGMDDGTE